MKINWQRASYTVEVAILIPLFFGIILFVIHMAISFYEESTQTEPYDRIEIMETFYAYQKWNIEDKVEGEPSD